MPITNSFFQRIYTFVDRFKPSDPIQRPDMDVVFDDLAAGINFALKQSADYVSEAAFGAATVGNRFALGETFRVGSRTFKVVADNGQITSDDGVNANEAGMFFSTLERAQAGDTLSSFQIFIGTAGYVPVNDDEDLITSDNRRWRKDFQFSDEVLASVQAAGFISALGGQITGRLGIGEASPLAAIHAKADDPSGSRLRVSRLVPGETNTYASAVFGVVAQDALIEGLGTDGDGTDGGVILAAGAEQAFRIFEDRKIVSRVAPTDEAWTVMETSPIAWGALEGNAASANRTVFTAMETDFQDRIVDMSRKSFLSPGGDVPDLNVYQNGFFVEEGAVGEAAVAHPQLNTMQKCTVPLTFGLCNSTWAQDNACWDEGLGEGFVAFSENNAHGVSDGSARVVVMRSRDGINWLREEIDLGFPCVVFGHEVYGGFQMLVVRDESGGPDDGKYRLYGRQLAQRIELSGIRQTEGTNDNRYSFGQADIVGSHPVMLYEGVEVQFNGLPADLGGVNLNAFDTVSHRTAALYEFRAGSNFAQTFDHAGVFECNVQETEFFEIQFAGGLSIGEAIEAAGGGTGEPTLLHGIQMYRPGVVDVGGNDFASRGDLLIGVSGGQFNAAVARIRNLVDATAADTQVLYVNEIPGANAALSEVTVTMQGAVTNDYFGFIRTQDDNSGQTVPAAFFHTANDFATVSLTNLPLGAFENTPIPVCVLGDDLIACASLERDGDDARGARKMAILKASIADAIAIGADAFSIIQFEEAEYKNQTLSGGATGVGVPSITPWGRGGKTVAAFWNQEANTNDPTRLDTVTQIMATKLSFDPNSFAHFGAEQIVWGHVPKPEWRLVLRGTPATPDDGFVLWKNVDRQSAPHGYDTNTGILTFPCSGTYRVLAQVSYEANTGSHYLQLRNGADDAFVGGGPEYWISGAYGRSDAQTMGSSETVIKVKGGETMAFKVNALGGLTDNNIRAHAVIELLVAH